MNCERVREQIPECLAGQMEKSQREQLIEHLETCAACRNELAELGMVWRGMESLAIAAEPEPVGKERFLESLRAYREGMLAAQPKPEPRAARWSGFVPRHPVWQFALAAALLLVGVAGGRYVSMPRGENPEMAQLKGQVEGLRQLAALSLLQEQSPSQRLEGVTYSVQMSRPDAQVEQALLHAVTRDPNINVRLSAVEALQKYAAKPEILRALEDAVAVQDSPLVQVSLIELLVDVNDANCAPALEKLSKDPAADETVRDRAAQALRRLSSKPIGEAR